LLIGESRCKTNDDQKNNEVGFHRRSLYYSIPQMSLHLIIL
jgi:hypothetical protein